MWLVVLEFFGKDFWLQLVQTDLPILKLMQTTNPSHPYWSNIFDDQINYQQFCSIIFVNCDIYGARRIATNNFTIDHSFLIRWNLTKSSILIWWVEDDQMRWVVFLFPIHIEIVVNETAKNHPQLMHLYRFFH